MYAVDLAIQVALLALQLAGITQAQAALRHQVHIEPAVSKALVFPYSAHLQIGAFFSGVSRFKQDSGVFGISAAPEPGQIEYRHGAELEAHVFGREALVRVMHDLAGLDAIVRHWAVAGAQPAALYALVPLLVKLAGLAGGIPGRAGQAERAEASGAPLQVAFQRRRLPAAGALHCDLDLAAGAVVKAVLVYAGLIRTELKLPVSEQNMPAGMNQAALNIVNQLVSLDVQLVGTE